MKILLSLFLVLLSTLSFTQIVFDKTKHDFGEINANDSRYVDIYLKNTTGKDAFILSVKKPMEVVYIQRSAFISPDSSSVIRFQINKKTKGKFSYTIPVFTSDKNEPTEIVLSGKIESLPNQSNNFTACPSFGQAPADGNPLDFMLTVETIDKVTGENLGKSKVAIIQNGSAIGKWETSSNGRLKLKIPLGITYFYATHPGYIPAEEGVYVNFKRNHVVLELTQKNKEPEIITPDTPETIEDPEELIVEDIPIKEEEIIAQTEERVIVLDETNPQEVDLSDIIEKNVEEEPGNIDAVTPPKFKELDENNFDDAHFKPVNVVFVIDVSSSMRQFDRLELLKYSLDQLVDMLRPQDKIGLVAYADQARVLLATTPGDQKEDIVKEVKDLKASGLTAGGAGIKLGYKQAKRNMIKDGQNHLIIITDGAFNRSSGDYKKYIEKNLRKSNITMSVVGIKSNEKAEVSMREAAELGNGRFILIEKLADAQTKLKQEIRLSSFKY
ncbi:MAG TPA: VWA domain-containing protein [Brumimicrobium sp.]|nr:VWA domain-containing protein [Brumimicrobium sp.]